MAGNTVIEIIQEIPSLSEAIKFSIRQSHLTYKHVCIELGIDQGNWSRVLSGQAQLPYPKLKELAKVCSNEIPLQWLAYQHGFELRQLKSRLEMELEVERAKSATLQQELNAVSSALSQRIVKCLVADKEN